MFFKLFLTMYILVLQLGVVKTNPSVGKNKAVRIALGQYLNVEVALNNGYLPHINFT